MLPEFPGDERPPIRGRHPPRFDMHGQLRYQESPDLALGVFRDDDGADLRIGDPIVVVDQPF